jgi:hypothetical protein
MEVVPFTARRLRPGAWEAFRQAWDPGADGYPPLLTRAIHGCNRSDRDEVVSLLFLEGSDEELQRLRRELREGEWAARQRARLERMAPHVAEVLVHETFLVERVVEGGGEAAGEALSVPLSARRLRPGSFGDWLEAFLGVADEIPADDYRAVERVTVMRAADDEDLVVSFGLGARSAWDRIFATHPDRFARQRELMAPYVEGMVLDAVYDVIEVAEPRSAG